MLPSVQREYENKIKAAEHKATEQYHIALRRAVEVINRADFLTEDEKKELIERIYK